MVKARQVDLTKRGRRDRPVLLSDVPGNKILESGIRGMIVDYLRIHGWMVWVVWQGPFSWKGVPDLEALRDGVTWRIEVKRPGGKLSKEQERFRDECLEHGGNWMVAERIEDVEGLAKRNVREVSP